jgi:Putative Ig domain
MDANGNIYVSDYGSYTIRRMIPSGTTWAVTTIAGMPGVSGTADGTGTNARFTALYYMAIDAASNLYVGDNNTCRKLSLSGTTWTVTTIAGSSVSGTNDGAGPNARFNALAGCAIGPDGALYCTDTKNFTVRRLALSSGTWTVTTVAGSPGASGTSDGSGTTARFAQPEGLTADPAGNLYVVDSWSYTIRKLSLSGTTWTVTTIAGSPGQQGAADGSGTAARFYYPAGINSDQYGNVYVVDDYNQRVRKLVPSGSNWLVTTIGGSGQIGSANGLGTSATFYDPQNICADNAGNLYLADTDNVRIALGTPSCAITSATTAVTYTGLAFTYQITGNGNPTSFTATGLPSGLSVNTATGLISGTVFTTGTSYVTITGSGAGGAGSAILAITTQIAPPAITSGTVASGTMGSGFSYQITASNNPTGYGANGLPAGLSVNAGTGLISGTPTATGTTNVTLSAANASGTGTAILLISVLPPAPVITSATNAAAVLGQPFSYQITASNNPTGYGAGGLPEGLSVNAISGLISGTATQTGTFAANVRAMSASGTGSAVVQIIVLTPLDSWKNAWFSPTQLKDPNISGDKAAPAGDGIPNLMKYALDLDPMTDGAPGLPVEGIMTLGGTNYLTLSCTLLKSATDITCTVEVSVNLKTWNSGSSYTSVVSVTDNHDGTETVVVQDLAPSNGTGSYMRLKVTKP